MSDLSATVHNLETLLQGKSTFADFRDSEVAIFRHRIAQLPRELQGATNLMVESLEAGASALVGAGQTAIGPILAESTDEQATQVANLLQLMGVRTAGVLSIAEHAALVAAINSLKAGLDRIGLKITTAGVQVVEDPPAPPAA